MMFFYFPCHESSNLQAREREKVKRTAFAALYHTTGVFPEQEDYSALLRLSTMSIFFILKCASTLTSSEKSAVRTAAYT